MKKLLFALSSVLLALTSAGCSSDDGENGQNNNGNGGNSGSNTNYIATYGIKTIKLSSYTNRNEYIIYEDYARRYSISFSEARMLLLPYERVQGSFKTLDANKNTCGISTFNGISSLEDLNEDSKAETRQNSLYYSGSQPYDRRKYSYTDFTPGCGFVAWFKTETGEDVYVRMYSADYTLDTESTLESVTIEYQLF